MTSYLPSTEAGYLPYWLLFISLTSLGNSVQSYLTTTYTARVYTAPPSPPHPSTTTTTTTTHPSATASATAPAYPSAPAYPITPLQSRTFGTWTFLSAVVRLYAAYHVRERVAYELALWTFGVALAHFGVEWGAFGTVRWGTGSAGPFVVSVGSLLWMGAAWGGYVVG